MENKENTEKNDNIEKKEEKKVEVASDPKNDSFKIKKNHLIFGGLILLVIIGIAIGFLFRGGATGSAVKDNEAAAEVNGEKISLASINKEYERIPAEQRPLIKRMDLLNQTIVTTLLLQEAKKSNIKTDNDEVTKVIGEINLPPGQDLNTILNMQGFSLDEFKGKIKEQLTIQKLLNNTIVVNVSDEEIADYFNKNKELLNQQLSINASHILVNSSQEAKDIITELKKGKGFEDLAKEKSLDPGSKDNGGNLGVFPKGAMVKEFEDAAFALKVGEISAPVKTTFGYHIIKVNEIFEEKEATLENSKNKIMELIKREKSSDAAVEYIRNLYANANIKIYLKEE